MNPGLPGTGIGGLFYVLSALWMPICEARRRWQGDATGRGAMVARQFAIALGVVAAVSGVFWLLDTVLMLERAAADAADIAHVAWSIRGSALLVTSGMLAVVLGAVELVGLRLRLRTLRRAAR